MTSTLLNGCGAKEEEWADKDCTKDDLCPICLARISQRIEDLQEMIKELCKDLQIVGYYKLENKIRLELKALKQATGETK